MKLIMHENQHESQLSQSVLSIVRSFLWKSTLYSSAILWHLGGESLLARQSSHRTASYSIYTQVLQRKEQKLFLQHVLLHHIDSYTTCRCIVSLKRKNEAEQLARSTLRTVGNFGKHWSWQNMCHRCMCIKHQVLTSSNWPNQNTTNLTNVSCYYYGVLLLCLWRVPCDLATMLL